MGIEPYLKPVDDPGEFAYVGGQLYYKNTICRCMRKSDKYKIFCYIVWDGKGYKNTSRRFLVNTRTLEINEIVYINPGEFWDQLFIGGE